MGLHYTSAVLAGATLGTLAALALWWPPIRGAMHRIADLIGAWLDGVVGALVDRLRPAA
jgi:membrane-associated phospholipid phosphatase